MIGDQGRISRRQDYRRARMAERKLRRLYLSDWHPTTDRPYAFGDHLVADRQGISVWSWVTASLDSAAIARKRLMETLSENGIDPSVFQLDPVPSVVARGVFVNENASRSGKYFEGQTLLGFQERLYFRYAGVNCRDWFTSDELESSTLRLI